MASISKQHGSNKLRIRFTFNGSQRELPLPTANKKSAQTICNMVERLIEQSKTNEPDRYLADWLKTISDDMRIRLNKAGLISSMPEYTLESILDLHFRILQGSWKPGSIHNRNLEREKIFSFYDKNTKMSDITQESAIDFIDYLKECGYAPCYIVKVRNLLKAVCERARNMGSMPLNPVTGIKINSVVLREKKYISVEDTYRLIEYIHYKHIELFLRLVRFGGLRPSEAVLLRPSDINLAAGTITFRSPKTEHHPGKDKRTIPIFNELHDIISKYAVSDDMDIPIIMRKKSVVDTAADYRKKTVRGAIDLNIESDSILTNMRGSCSTDLKARFPEHVVDSWLGHSKEVANKHYDVVTSDYYSIAQKPGMFSPIISPQSIPIMANQSSSRGCNETANDENSTAQEDDEEDGQTSSSIPTGVGNNDVSTLHSNDLREMLKSVFHNFPLKRQSAIVNMIMTIADLNSTELSNLAQFLKRLKAE